MDKKNKILLVTGASSDVGMALIKEVYQNYSIVIAHYRHMSNQLQQLKNICGDCLYLIQADFSDFGSRMHKIEVLKSEGYFPDHIVHLPSPKYENIRFTKASIDTFHVGMQISFYSIIEILTAFLPSMAKKQNGKIIFMLTSFINTPVSYCSPYLSTKYSLLGLMKALAKEYAGKHININGVSPSMMETKFISELPELITMQKREQSPIGRNITVEDVIPTIEFLLSENSNMITGQNIEVTGGN